MRIRKLTAIAVRLSLKRRFKHASATRDESDNVLIRCELSDGTVGWGEGVPRSYVTGETADGCLAQLAATPIAQQLDLDCSSWPDVINLCQKISPTIEFVDRRGSNGNALRCALELSVLDAFGRLLREPVSNAAKFFLPVTPILKQHNSVQYSAAIGSGSRGLVRQSLVRRAYGFRQYKVKVGAAGDDDEARLRTIRKCIGRRMDLRVDANEAWPAREARAKIQPLLQYEISCVEQPVPHQEVKGLAELRQQINVPIMLDESLTSLRDAESAIADGTCDLFNIRLSKCGGFLNSLRLAAMATSAGIGFQLGCHPGESGILSAAGRHWACSVAGTRYLEGSYDRHLLRKLPTNEDITLGYRGLAPALTGPGLGVTINESVLKEMTLARQEYVLE